MSPKYHEMVRDFYPHTIHFTRIESPRAAYDIIKWCIDNTQGSWHKTLNNQELYIQFQDTRDYTLFLLVWTEDTRVTFTTPNITEKLGI